ncbi:Protein-export membrane protein SecD [Rubellimicrobium mesophilum DSM 19309]|uniref:Protein translocase subunit SecD n=1 Tax=Rubellimicrobium mesophilum DSM 19309 TaxID=442562 RepID=A0A017HRS7_9RHOB|nr:protein translocase subunit SecD [Rubellimicrobium mesophilum]EYD77051.1 Protein-export membrane protein SecD [Rubellimicrobium mesophilum DSM 19309]
MIFIPLWQRLMVAAVVVAAILFAMPNLFYTRVEQANDARGSIEGGITSAELEGQASEWPSWLPSRLINLGLDLRGGAHLLAEVQVADVYASRMDSLWPTLRDALAAERDTVGFVTREDGPATELRVRVSNPDGVARALEIIRGMAQPVASLTGGGTSDIEATANGDVVTVQLSDAEKAATDSRTVDQALEIVRRRIDEAGTREPTILRQGNDRILVQVPGAKSAQEVIDLIGTTAQLTFNPVVNITSNPNADPGTGNVLVPSSEQPGTYYILERAPVVTGEDLTNSQPSFDQNGRPAVSFQFDPTGARAFGEYTGQHIGEPFAIVLDNEVISAPTIQSAIPGGSGIITGSFTTEESTNLAVLLRAGALPAKLNILEQRTIGPELGADSIQAGKNAAYAAAVLVVLFMIASYGFFGFIAVVALAINIVMIFALLSILGATLTLPGIAGIVLTMGQAVDANVLIYERMREELRRGASPVKAIQEGFAKAHSAILDANVTTFIVAAIMFFVGTGTVRGFAVTLAMGVVTTMLTGVFVSRVLVTLWFNRARPKTITV